MTRRPKGRLFGRNVLEGMFRAAPDEDLFIGELLVGVDEATGRRYVFRVVDVTYGSEHREPGWAERVAGTLLADDERGETGVHPLHEQERRTYRVADCRCLGYLAPPEAGSDGVRSVFRKPKSLPSQFSAVVAPTPADFAFLAERMGDLPVGKLRSGETVVDLAVGIPGSSLATHVGHLRHHRHGQVQPDAGPGRRGDAGQRPLRAAHHRPARRVPHRPGPPPVGCHARCGSTPTARCPGTSALRVSLAELTVDDLRTAYEWSRPQEEALYELERHFDTAGLAWLADFARIEDLPGFRDVELSSRVALNTLQVVHRRARRIVDLRCIAARPGVSVGGRILDDLLAGKVVLVDVSGLGSTEEVLVASFLARRVLETWQAAYLDDPDRHRPHAGGVAGPGGGPAGAQRQQGPRVQRVPPGGPRRAEVRGRAVRRHPATEAARGRAAQSVQHLLHPRAWPTKRTATCCGAAAKQDISAQGAEIQTLMPGECLIVNLAAPFALPAMIDLYADLVRATPPPPAPRPAGSRQRVRPGRLSARRPGRSEPGRSDHGRRPSRRFSKSPAWRRTSRSRRRARSPRRAPGPGWVNTSRLTGVGRLLGQPAAQGGDRRQGGPPVARVGHAGRAGPAPRGG